MLPSLHFSESCFQRYPAIGAFSSPRPPPPPPFPLCRVVCVTGVLPFDASPLFTTSFICLLDRAAFRWSSQHTPLPPHQTFAVFLCIIRYLKPPTWRGRHAPCPPRPCHPVYSGIRSPTVFPPREATLRITDAFFFFLYLIHNTAASVPGVRPGNCRLWTGDTEECWPEMM